MRSCRICGCTDLQACPGGCHWVAPDLCSACALDEEDTADLALPVDDCVKPSGHQPIWLTSDRGYCVHCRAPLVCEAANV
jgi:hypothetical protein